MLRITGSILVTETTNEARIETAKQAGTKRVAIIALGDACPLCEALDGKVMDVDEAGTYQPPFHINCHCILSAVGDDEVGAFDKLDPTDPMLKSLVEEHGHFITDPDKFAVLRVPSSPGSRDFVFRRRKNAQTGEIESVIEWKRPRYPLEGLAEGTVEVGP